jgi:hypothetical protein
MVRNLAGDRAGKKNKEHMEVNRHELLSVC